MEYLSMFLSLAMIFIVGLAMSSLMKKIKLPGIVGMLLTGILLGPYCFKAFGWNGFLDDKILSISSELRKIALVIILLKAGLSLNLKDLKKVGRPALLMSFIPASFEIVGYVIVAPLLLDISYMEAALMGAVMGAVSPAVVVPRMVKLMDEKYGTEKGVPQMIIAGASCDDVFVIVLFTTFLGLLSNGSENTSIGSTVMSFVNIPISIIVGILVGCLIGFGLYYFFEYCHSKGRTIRNSIKVIIILAISFLLVAIEEMLPDNWNVFSGLLAVMSMACVIGAKSVNKVTDRLSSKFGKLWLAAEVGLFVLVGAEVDVNAITGQFAGMAIALIFIALIFRSLGVYICLLGTKLNMKERLFTILSYLPKATVQAAIGGVALANGLACGQIVLTIAVVGIIITAPLGAFCMDLTYKKLLVQNTSLDNGIEIDIPETDPFKDEDEVVENN